MLFNCALEVNSLEKISIIIPIYNTEKYLEKCIGSVLNQTYTNLEIILVDDGSTDGSRSIIESYVEKDTRVQAIFKSNGGQNSARKAGIMRATGKYTMFVDSDDYVDYDICQKLADACKAHSATIAGCGMNNINMDGTISHVMMPTKTGKMEGKEAALLLVDIKNFFRVNFIASLCGYIFETGIIRNILVNFDERIVIGEDIICQILALWDSKSIYIVGEALYNVVIRMDSTLHNHEKRYYDTNKALYYYGLSEFQKRAVPMEMYISLEQLIMESCLVKGYAEAFGHLDYLFPFADVKKHSRIVVYGAGGLGIEIVRHIKASSAYELVSWVDKDYQTIRVAGYRVEAPFDFLKYQYDYVVVAVTKNNVTKQIVQTLLEKNVEREKIKTIQPELISYSALPESFFVKESK